MVGILVDMVNIALFTRFFTSKLWLFGISEPSTLGHPFLGPGLFSGVNWLLVSGTVTHIPPTKKELLSRCFSGLLVPLRVCFGAMNEQVG